MNDQPVDCSDGKGFADAGGIEQAISRNIARPPKQKQIQAKKPSAVEAIAIAALSKKVREQETNELLQIKSQRMTGGPSSDKQLRGKKSKKKKAGKYVEQDEEDRILAMMALGHIKIQETMPYEPLGKGDI